MTEFTLALKDGLFAALLLFAPIWAAMAINGIWKAVSKRKNSKRIAHRNAEKALRAEHHEEIEYVKFLGENL